MDCGAPLKPHVHLFPARVRTPNDLPIRLRIDLPEAEPLQESAGAVEVESASYRLQKTCLGNPLDLQVTTEKRCVYCASLRDPSFSDPEFPEGVGVCQLHGAVGFRRSCESWVPNKKVRFWLSKGDVQNNREGWPRRPWYVLFDDGPDGEAGTRG